MRNPFSCFKSIALIVLFLLPGLLFSQDTSMHPHRKPLLKPIAGYMVDTIVPAGPNEFSLNLAPFFTTMIGAYPNEQFRASLYYKHQLRKPQNLVRIGILYLPETRQIENNVDDVIFQQTDSTRYRNSFTQSRKRPLQLNLGIEHRTKGPWRWTGYVSMDVMAGFYNRDYDLIDYNEKTDSTGAWVIDFNSAQPSLELDHKRTSNWYIGFSPAIGFRYAFNKRWVINLQTGADFSMVKSEGYKRSALGYSLESVNLDSFDVYLPGLFNEFALTLRF